MMLIEASFILLAGGILLGLALPAPDRVARAWLVGGGVLAAAFAVVGALAAAMRVEPEGVAPPPQFFLRIQAALVGLTCAATLLHVALAGTGRLRVQRWAGVGGFLVALLAGSNLLHHAMLAPGTAVAFPPKAFSMALQTLTCAGAAAVPGVAFAYALFPLLGVGEPLAAAASFRRLHRALLLSLSVRAVASIAGVFLLTKFAPPLPPERAWDPALAATRWSIGLVAPAVLAAVAYRRAARGLALSAAAVLLLAGLCAMNGEAIALALARRTGLPF
jgi:hypothetical protein